MTGINYILKYTKMEYLHIYIRFDFTRTWSDEWNENRIPSSWAEASPSSPSAPDCALHPAPSASESHAQSGGGISHSDGKKTTNQMFQPKIEGSII